MTAGIEIAARKNILGVKDFYKLISRQKCLTLINFQNNILKIVFFLFIVGHYGNSGDPRQFAPVLLIVTAVYLDKFIKAFHIGQSHCRRNLVHLSIYSET